ncbi:MAG: CvpA family protein [Planctomycetota bacterium]|nr:MAG: CvpA family protein [Planctomycetota bacterium]
MFVIADFLRGAIRVLGGILALITAVVMAYFFYPIAGAWVLQFWSLPAIIANIVGGFSIFLITEILGLFLYPYLIRKFFRKLDALERKGIQLADQEEKEELAEEKKGQGRPQQVKSASEDDDLEEMGDDLEISLMERFWGALIGAVKALVLIFGLIFGLHLFPTPAFIQKAIEQSFMGKVYQFYFAKPLEREFPSFKVMNNMGDIIAIGQEVSKNPEKAERIKNDKQIQKLMSLKPVQDFMKSEKDFLQWAKEHPWEALQDEKVKKLLENPAVKEEFSKVNFRKIKKAIQ